MTILSDELTNDPNALGYQTHITAGNHQAVADLLNEPRYSTVGAKPIPSRALLQWSGPEARLDKIKDAATNHALADVRSAAEAARLTISRSDTALDLSLTDNQNMLNGLVAGGVLSEDDKASLEALSTRDISRAEQIGLGRVSHRDIREAL